MFCGHPYGRIRVFNEANRIYISLFSSEKINKNLGGRLELLTSILHGINRIVYSYFMLQQAINSAKDFP